MPRAASTLPSRPAAIACGSATMRSPIVSKARIAPAMSPPNESTPPRRAYACVTSGSVAPGGTAAAAARAAASSAASIRLLASQTAARSFESTGTSSVRRSAFVGENAGREPIFATSWRYSVAPSCASAVETSCATIVPPGAGRVTGRPSPARASSARSSGSRSATGTWPSGRAPAMFNCAMRKPACMRRVTCSTGPFGSTSTSWASSAGAWPRAGLVATTPPSSSRARAASAEAARRATGRR